ncbi:MAG: bifunctional 4-hydroxy-2-oxoglutarate aldolase/2-dehydro-3-deoxy-phosphogluconate aldolase [Cyanobacteriota bacterium]|nr:bifunctional 4-hydroxy-2-oxoglutarate aldolase/2-dehydro-3-deoxy-phosphogluconate aldolase [Cyanobacteriota bacterium]
MRAQPLLVVLRSLQPHSLQPQIERLASIGTRHIEIAWSDHPAWVEQTQALMAASPAIRFGAASIVSERALCDVHTAGLSFAVSPVLDADLLGCAAELGIALVPGVFSPTEVHRAAALGCPLVKLYPAATLGPHHWRRLAGPLGPLPFCIAAGGLGPADLGPWLTAGVDAVAIGGSLSGDQAWQQLTAWLAEQRG